MQESRTRQREQAVPQRCSPRSANRGMSIVFSTTCACGSSTACTTKKSTTLTMCCQLSSPRPAPVQPAGPTQQGHRPPCGCTATVESSTRRLDLGDQPLRHDKDADEFVVELQLQNLKMSSAQTRTWATVESPRASAVRTMGTCRCSTMAKSTTSSKICTCWISTGYRTDCPVGICLSLRATHPYESGLDIPDNNKSFHDMKRSKSVSASTRVSTTLSMQGNCATSKVPWTISSIKQVGLCSTSGASPGRQQCWCALSKLAPASYRRVTAGTRTGCAIRGRPVGHP